MHLQYLPTHICTLPRCSSPTDTQLYYSVHSSSTCTTNFNTLQYYLSFLNDNHKIQRYQTAYISYMLLMIIMNFSLIKSCGRTAFHSLSTCIGPLQVRVHVFAGHQGSSQHFCLWMDPCILLRPAEEVCLGLIEGLQQLGECWTGGGLRVPGMLDENCTTQTGTANIKSEDTYLSLDAGETATKATTR